MERPLHVSDDLANNLAFEAGTQDRYKIFIYASWSLGKLSDQLT
jgi:putative AlgH/UPF0301 family transcriptional regulator